MTSSGFLFFGMVSGFVVLLEDVVVHPDHRGQGFGGRLLDHAVQFAKDRDFRRITLLTDKISDRSQQFFHHHGFYHSKMIPMRIVFSDEGAPPAE